MEKINWGRVVLGGLLAGAVLIALATASAALFMGQHALRTAVQGLRPSTSGSAAPIFFILVFVFLGNVLTWSYTTMRPRFGPGPKTAAIAGLSVWLTAVGIGVAGFAVKSVAMGQPYSLPSGPMWPMLYLLMIVASTIAGAWVYKEQQP